MGVPSRVVRVFLELTVVAAVIAVVWFAQDQVGETLLRDGEYRWDHLLQNATTNVTAPTTAPVAGTLVVTFRYDLPGVGTVQVTQFRTAVSIILVVTINQVTITQIIQPIPALLQNAKFHVEQTPGSRVIFSIAGLTQAQAAAAQNTLNAGCAANLASVGVDCASLATSTTIVPVAAPTSDDDTSGLVGGLVGGIGGCCCLVAIAVAGLLILKKKKQQQQQYQQQELYSGGVQPTAPAPSPFAPGPFGPNDPNVMFGPKPVGGPFPPTF